MTFVVSCSGSPNKIDVEKMRSFSSREALLSVSQNFFEEVDLGAGDVKVRTLYFKLMA